MTLQIVPGFNVAIPGTELFFEPPANGRLLNAADVPQLLNNPASWLYHATRSEPLALIENDLTDEETAARPQTVGSLTLEFLTSVAVLPKVQRYRVFCEAGQGYGARSLD